MHDDQPAAISTEILAYYDDGREQGRLLGGAGRLEYARTQQILQRVLPPPPARVLDVGGGPGAYAHWLTSLGYGVTLVDPVPRHIEQARAPPRMGMPPRSAMPVLWPPATRRRMPCCSSARSTT